MSEQIEDNKPETFERAMKRLEEIVEEMERGRLELETLIARFEEGRRLSALCEGKLDEVEQRIETLVRTDSGGLSVERLDLDVPGDGR